jgi:hypothetical protein
VIYGEALESLPSQLDSAHIKDIKKVVEDIQNRMNDPVEKSRNPALSTSSQYSFDTNTPIEALDIKEAVVDISSAVGECRVEVAIVKALLEEKSAETDHGITDLAKVTNDSSSEIKSSIAVITDSIAAFKDVMSEFQEGSHTSIVAVQEIVEELQTSTAEANTATSNTFSEFRAETKGGISQVQSVVDSIREETKESFEEVNKTVEGAQVEVKEAVAVVDRKVEAVQDDIKISVTDIRTAISDSQNQTLEGLTALTTSLETSQAEAKEDGAVIKKLVEDSTVTNETGHGKTQKQVTEVIGLVDDLQTELKGHQPTLLNALLEMKNLLLDVQEVAATKPEIELPPPYDDSQTQEKLNQLIQGNNEQVKRFTQLELLDTIQKQVSSTSATLSEFIEHRKTVTREDATAKVQVARRAEMDLEKATTEKRLVEAATARLRDEHDKLQVQVDILQEETEGLREKKLDIVAELAGIETALTLRREELLMLEARGEALERRLLDGIIEQSRRLTKPKGTRAKGDRVSLKQKTNASTTPVNLERRHFSQSNVGIDSPSSTKGGRVSLSGGTLGLGQKEYSANLGILGRSHSMKNYSRKGSLNKPSVIPKGVGDAQYSAAVDEEAEFQEFQEEYEMESDGEGSVVRVNTDGEEELSSPSNNYPALALDFSERNPDVASRSVSGVSSVA